MLKYTPGRLSLLKEVRSISRRQFGILQALHPLEEMEKTVYMVNMV